MAEIKPVSFRLNEESIEKFKQLAGELDCNQAEMFDSLMGNFELAKAKNQILDRGKEIETFQSTTNTLVNMFVNSLAINQTAEETLREKLSEELNSKETTIKDLQEQRAKTRDEIMTVKESIGFYENQNKGLTTELQMNKTELAQKTNTIDSQLEQIGTLNSIITEFKAYKNINVELEVKNKELVSKNSALQHSNVDLEGKVINKEQMLSFYKGEIDSLKHDKTEIARQLQQADIEYKSEIQAEKNNLERKFNLEIDKIKAEFQEKLQFEKEKMQLEESKLISRNDSLEEKYNNVIFKIEENKIETNKQNKPKSGTK
jgi:chromosome segregation ATPase